MLGFQSTTAPLTEGGLPVSEPRYNHTTSCVEKISFFRTIIDIQMQENEIFLHTVIISRYIEGLCLLLLEIHATTPVTCSAHSRKQLISEYLSFSIKISPSPYPGKKSLDFLAVLSGSFSIAFEFPRSHQQASFGVPGDFAREGDLGEEIAPIELVWNNKCAKYNMEFFKDISAVKSALAPLN